MNNDAPSLAIVIHTEEEFDWSGGFYRSNNDVTHGKELTELCEQLIAVGAKITFALDYAFVSSEQGEQVIKHFKEYHSEHVEFATHLHPWVNPPQESDSDEVSNLHSYPGNLPQEIEFEKLEALTQKIEQVSGDRPVTYLAGRYGIGPNTYDSLIKLGYKVDCSVSPFTDFSHQQGPDFSHRNNQSFSHQSLYCVPHTTAIVSAFDFVAKWFDRNPAMFEKMLKRLSTKILLKLLRVKRQRLSPEGFSLEDLKKVTDTQLKLGYKQLILSFHSPSAKQGLTPYVSTPINCTALAQSTLNLIKHYKHNDAINFELVREFDNE